MNKLIILFPMFLLSGCVALLHHDRTSDPRASNIANQCFSSVEPGVLFNRCGKTRFNEIGYSASNKCLGIAGNNPNYKNCPSIFGAYGASCQLEVLNTFPINTKFKIIKVEDTAMGESGRHWSIIAKGLSGTLKGKEFKLPSKWYSPYWVSDKPIKINSSVLNKCKT